jgi:hypothetical protein
MKWQRDVGPYRILARSYVDGAQYGFLWWSTRLYGHWCVDVWIRHTLYTFTRLESER